MEQSEKAKDRRGIWRLLYLYAHGFLAKRYNYSCEQVKAEGPFLLISNHVTNNDPFFVGLSSVERPLTYVASSHLFRLGVISKIIIKLVDPIARSKASSGASTVIACLRRIKRGESIVLFAEGDCSWDGLSIKVSPSTGKLAKSTGAPLVTYRLQGGYLSRPRWANKMRRGAMHGGPVRVYSPEELDSMTAEEVTEAINRDIFVDAWADQRENMTAYRCKAPAEGLERALFICPECGGAGCLSGRGAVFSCGKCGAEWKMDEYGFLHGPRFGAIAEWEAMQKQAVKQLKGEKLFACRGSFTDLNSGRAVKKTELWLNADGACLVIGGETVKKLSDIKRMAMVKTDRLLFEDAESYFEFKSERASLRPYLMLWRYMHADKGGTK